MSNFHKTIKKVSEDIESLKFNTAIAAMMALVNDIYTTGNINRAELRTLTILLNPFAPHLTEEIYEANGFGGVLNEQKWATYDESLCVDETVEIVVQICGKVKTKMNVPVGAAQEDVLAQAAADPKIAALIEGKQVLKQIYVQNKLVNFVVK
jgi:leucyl-tRNA synthetase